MSRKSALSPSHDAGGVATAGVYEQLFAGNSASRSQTDRLRRREQGRLVVPSSMSVAAAHEICDRLEHAIKTEFFDALISIHVEPDVRPSTPALS